MNIFKRTVAVITVFLLALTCFCGCGGNGSDTSDNSSAVEMKFAESNFLIVVDKSDEQLLTKTKLIIKAVKNATGVSLKIEDLGSAENSDGEILLGETDRAESLDAIKLLKESTAGRAKEYIICTVNGKIVINGMSEEAILSAVDKFIADYCSKGTMMSNEKYIKTDSETYPEITLGGVSVGEFKIVIPEYNVSYLVLNEVEMLKNAILAKTGFNIQVVRDNTTADGNEIIIGDCKRDGVKGIGTAENYEIAFRNGNLYVLGGKNYALSHAVVELTDKINVGQSLGSDTISGVFDGKTADRDYSLVWTDEFDTLDLSTTWRAQSGVQNYYGSWYGMGTARSVEPENLCTKDDMLYITATYDDRNFYGVYLDTAKSVNFTYGYIEMSAKLPDGDGIWSDLWTWSDKKEHLEFDIAECWGPGTGYATVIHEFSYADGVNRTDKSVMEAHISSTGEHLKYQDWLDYRKNESSLSLNDSFHTYGCEWTESEVIFYFDGVVTSKYNYENTPTAHLYREPHYFILSMLVGSNYHDYTEDMDLIKDREAAVLNPILGADYWSNGKNQFVIEYLQLFQKDGQYLQLG